MVTENTGHRSKQRKNVSYLQHLQRPSNLENPHASAQSQGRAQQQKSNFLFTATLQLTGPQQTQKAHSNRNEQREGGIPSATFTLKINVPF